MDIVTYALCKKIAAGAISGIANITQSGNTMVITSNDGQVYNITLPTPAAGVSVASIIIDSSNHLICTMSDGSTIDAGEIPGGVGGGVIQENSMGFFPVPGDEDTLYLARDTEKLYYWNGSTYQAITPDATLVLAELETAQIPFDGVNTTFDLPIDSVAYNVYVNGMYYAEGEDYTIDRSVSPNQIIFNEIYENWEIGRLTYLKAVPAPSGDGVVLEYATDADIDTLFDGSSTLNLATDADIDNLFNKAVTTDGN